ncbi:MAG: hypothetical protein IPL46_23860 [Saprospiraceae bacterium]|nr:hypothetical protein [Saprospiraceae bacterium]
MGKYKVIPEQKDEYLGNIWGWKTSLMGLALIVFMLGLMLFRSCQIDNLTEGEPIEHQSE